MIFPLSKAAKSFDFFFYLRDITVKGRGSGSGSGGGGNISEVLLPSSAVSYSVDLGVGNFG